MADPDPDDVLDGCAIDFAEHADDEETAALRALFPDGQDHGQWAGVEFAVDASEMGHRARS